MNPTYYQHPYQTFPFETFHRLIGGKNWIIGRRTPNNVARYGADVICLSPSRYTENARIAHLTVTEGYD